MVGEDFSHMTCEQCKEAARDGSKAEPAFSECAMVPLNRPDESDDEDTGWPYSVHVECVLDELCDQRF